MTGRLLRIATIGAFCLWAGTSACAETLTVYNDAQGDAFVTFDQPGKVGDKTLWRSEMQTKDGTVIGIGSGECTRLDAVGNRFCSLVIDLDGRGMIAAQGVQLKELPESTYPITGGTGEFAGIVGQLRSKPVEDRARFMYVIEY